MTTAAYPVVLTNGQPTVDFTGPATATNGDPKANADTYRTITTTALNGYGTPNSDAVASDLALSLGFAESYLGTVYPATNGVLIVLDANGVPTVGTTGQDGYGVQQDANGNPVFDASLPVFSGDSAGPDGARLWIERTFGKR